MNALLIVAFGFANLAILGWIAAAAAPILIHLWMKRMQRETPWAAIRFLQAAIKRHSRRLRIQEWLLLAIRTAVIVLVVLAAAKPLLDRMGGLLNATGQTHRVLVIDASMSMQYQSADSSLLSDAKRLATSLVKQSSSGDSFSLCVLANPSTTPHLTSTTDTTSLLKAIDAIEPTDGNADLAGMILQLDDLLTAHSKRPNAAERTEIVFFSDLTRSTWQPLATAAPDESPAAATALLEPLSQRARLTLFDMGAGPMPNLAATQLRITSGAPTLKQSVRIRGTIQQFGGSAPNQQDELEVELMVDGLAVASQTIAASAEPVSVEFDYRFRRPGWRRIALRLPADRLTADDTRFLGVQIKPHIAVLCVEGRQGAASYVADALNPGGDPEAAIQPLVVSDAELAATDLTGYDAVVLCNVAEFTTREAERIDRYARTGGGVIFFLGDRVRPERYNAMLGDPIKKASARLTPHVRLISLSTTTDNESSTAPLLPVTLGRSVSQTSYGVDPLGYQHPIIAPFRGRERAGLLTTPVERYFKMQIQPAATEATAVFATSSGDPLLVAAPVGAGRVAVMATAGSLASVDTATGRPWTAMPAWPSFVPIVRELVRYTSAASIQADPHQIHQPLTMLQNQSYNEPMQVVRPDGTSDTVSSPSSATAWKYTRTDRIGFYSIKSRGTDEARQITGVNPSGAESDTQRLRADQLPPAIAIRQANWRSDASAPELIRPVGIHRHLLLAALLLVLIETWLACQFGRGAG